MCRVYYNPSPTDVEDLTNTFSYLEGRLGGHGNGIALLHSGETIKAVKAQPSYLAERAVKAGEPIFFHTRKSTVGGICDVLCQPFTVGHVTVAHNGHWGKWQDGLELLMRSNLLRFIPLNLSDSRVATFMAYNWGVGALRNYITTGVWLYAKRRMVRGVSRLERVTAIVNQGDLAVNFTTGEAASEPTFWAPDDQVMFPKPGSVVELYPDTKLVCGELGDEAPGTKKGGKK